MLLAFRDLTDAFFDDLGGCDSHIFSIVPEAYHSSVTSLSTDPLT